MGFSIACILQAVLLCLNAMAILSERRFLSKYGLATATVMSDHGGDGAYVPSAFVTGEDYATAQRFSSLRSQVGSVLSSVRTLLRLPLILSNTVVIIFTLIFG